MRLRPIALVLSAAALTAEAPAPDLQAYEQALAGSHFSDAAAAIDKIIAQRTPSDGKPRSDPLVNALLGRLYLGARNAEAAATYLDRAPLAELPVSIRAPTALDHARALELRGDRTHALAAYRDAELRAQSDELRHRATLGIARLLLPQDPAAARDHVLAIANGSPSPDRWQAKYVLALSASLLGRRNDAAKYADEAWQDALDSRLKDLAPLHVMALRAGLAAAEHDFVKERSMLTAINGLSVQASPELSAQMPTCGDRGILPSDYVTFIYVTGPYMTADLLPVAASRIEAVTPFQEALGAIAPIQEAVKTAQAGTIFTAACRTVVNPNYLGASKLEDPLMAWFAASGIYPASATNEDEDVNLNAIADRTDVLAAKFGTDSPLLIGPRWQMLTALEKRAVGGDAVLPGQLTDLERQIAAGMRQAGAPDWLAATIESRSRYRQAAAAVAADPSQAGGMMELAREQLLRAPFVYARTFFIEYLNNYKGDWPAEASRLIVNLDAKAPANLTGRDGQAWKMNLAHAEDQLGRKREARAALTAAGFAPDLCVAADSEPSLLEQHFSYSDYPHDLIAGDQEGSVLFEFDLAPSGAVASKRIIYSLPAGLFDAPSAKGLSTVRYTAPGRSGKAVSCRGLYQPIIWRLEDNNDFVTPSLAPGVSGPTT